MRRRTACSLSPDCDVSKQTACVTPSVGIEGRLYIHSLVGRLFDAAARRSTSRPATSTMAVRIPHRHNLLPCSCSRFFDLQLPLAVLGSGESSSGVLDKAKSNSRVIPDARSAEASCDFRRVRREVDRNYDFGATICCQRDTVPAHSSPCNGVSVRPCHSIDFRRDAGTDSLLTPDTESSDESGPVEPPSFPMATLSGLGVSRSPPVPASERPTAETSTNEPTGCPRDARRLSTARHVRWNAAKFDERRIAAIES